MHKHVVRDLIELKGSEVYEFKIKHSDIRSFYCVYPSQPKNLKHSTPLSVGYRSVDS